MKTNEEIAALAFSRRREHDRAAAKRKKAALGGTVTVVCGAALTFAVLSATGRFRRSPEPDPDKVMIKTANDEQQLRDDSKAAESAAKDTVDNGGEAPVETKDVIVINEGGNYSDSACFAGEPTTREAIEGKFDIKVIPDAPEGFDTSYFSECFGGDETPLYWYHMIFSSTERHGWLETMVTNRDPQLDESTVLPETGADMISRIGGVEIPIFHWTTQYGDENGIKGTHDNYVCSFRFGGEYFWMLSNGLSKDEFIASIRSIVGQ